ncbi:hypothetical protein niasHT_023230 [Heterodera trifolii]|uniref:DNA mismatch repair protein MutS core domain-containing protein n=1 Tax=Heterodera trifolii TaxID=157864 RepID=A0ABD2JDL9_9BILA
MHLLNEKWKKSYFNLRKLFYIAIIEGKGGNRGQIGMAAMDIRYSELTLCQFVDTNSYTLLRIRLSLCEIAEVILPEENEKSPARLILLDMLRNTCPKANITTLQRRYFNDSLGIDLVTKLNVEECSNVDTSVFKKYFCMSASAALIKYVEYIQNILYAHNSLKITYEAVEDSCLIDVNSWASLDLLHSEMESNKGCPNSLFEILNCCLTRGGTRTLRTYLLQPSASVEIINSRLDIVQELVKNQAMCDRIRSILSNLHDLQQLVSFCTYTNVEQSATNREESKRVIRNKIIQIIELKRLLEAVKKISEVISHSKSPFFMQNKKKLDDCRLDAIAEFVNDKISSELTTRKRKGLVASSSKDQILFAIAESQHVLLDVARRTYQELVARIVEFGTAHQKEIPGAQLCYSQSRGYHFALHANDPYSINLPSHCIQVVFNKASLTFTTRDLIKYNDRLLQSENEILHKSNLVLDQLIGSIREYIPALYKCTELVSLFDYYTALACYCSKVQTVRPSFGKELLVLRGRHPILDYRMDVVPNDTRASHSESRFAVIAGPNMAGKSTYMRQICMLQILAQMGCMVPAESASFVPMTRIFSRVGHNDDLVQNLSGFAVEVCPNCLIKTCSF